MIVGIFSFPTSSFDGFMSNPSVSVCARAIGAQIKKNLIRKKKMYTISVYILSASAKSCVSL